MQSEIKKGAIKVGNGVTGHVCGCLSYPQGLGQSSQTAYARGPSQLCLSANLLKPHSLQYTAHQAGVHGYSEPYRRSVGSLRPYPYLLNSEHKGA